MEREEEYVVPTWRMRLRLSAKWLGVMTIILLLSWGVETYNRHIAHIQFCDGLIWSQLVLVVLCFVLLTGATRMARLGWRILASGRMPPPGTPVMFRTKIYRNWFAQFNAACLIFFSLMLAGTVAYALFGLHLADIFVSKSECLRQMASEKARH